MTARSTRVNQRERALMGGQKPKSGPHIYWRNGRAYGDFRSYADVGGGREALSEKPATWGTTDNKIAQELFKR